MQANKGSKSGQKSGTGAARKAGKKPLAAEKRKPSALAMTRATAKRPARAGKRRGAAKIADHSTEKVIFPYIARIAAERNMDRLMPLLADFGRDLIGADRCTVWLCNDKAGILWSKVAHGVPRMEMSKTKGIAGWVATHGEALIINDPYSDERFDQEFDRRTGYLTRSILSLPILDADGRISGVYQAVNKMTGTGGFSEEDKEHLLLAATYTAEVLKTAQMQEEIEATQREIIFTISEAVEVRSKETGKHIKRIAEYCRLLAMKHGLSEAETDVIRQSSPMHDIGKVGIKDSILNKEGKLDEAEREEMKKHAAIGHYILKSSERRLLSSAAIIAHQHHERWDGGDSGYPCHLKGEKIHLYGRITAIADVFDALVNDRVYKKAWDLPQIVELFKAERGKQFDPDLTREFLESFDEFVRIKDAYRDKPPQPGEPGGCPES
jgi:HD-GYP domain-containing protein (c-di-GMP phosphodiesterase class II)